MKKYLIYDVESGGLSSDKHSLLTAYFKVIDQNFQQIDTLSLKIKPPNATYAVTAKALSINKIDLVKHYAEAISIEEARRQLVAFLSRHSASGESPLTPVGHNVTFDEGFVQKQLLEDTDRGISGKESWEMYVSYRRIDTAALAEALRMKGVIPASVGSSLGSLCQFFGIDSSGAHDAQVDVDMTGDLLRGMLNFVIRPKTV